MLRVAKNTNLSISYIRESGVFQNYLEEVKGRTGKCTIVCVIVAEMLFLPPYYGGKNSSHIPGVCELQW